MAVVPHDGSNQGWSAVYTLALLTITAAASTIGPQAGGPPVPAGWAVYRNEALGYELRHPDGYIVFATGRAGERDGSRIRVALEEYAAPAPVLDIYVRRGITGVQLPDAVRRAWETEESAVDMAGGRCAMTTYRFERQGQIALFEIRCPDVLFRLTPAAREREVRGSVWWQIISTFRFLPSGARERD